MNSEQEKKRFIFKIVIGLAFLILVGRCVQLQVFDWEKYYRESERNRIREVITAAPRGLMFDRNGKILVDNRPAYSVSVIPHEFLKSHSGLALFSRLMNEEPKYILNKINREKISNFSPVKLKRQLGFRELSFIEEYRLDLPGVVYNTESRRYYPAGVRAPHLFGYVGEITSEELKGRRGGGYRLGDDIGKNGLELVYERYLRGTFGQHFVEVDALGREVRDLTELPWQEPRPGKNLYLTIDAEIQKFLEQQMSQHRGAAVVLDVRNGEVLALVSKPDYDPEIFSKPISPEIWNQLINHEGKPLYNRACQSLYPPGSTFKLVLAAAALESGKVDPYEKVLCQGFYRLGQRNYDCWKKGGHGWVNLFEAIEQSCNVYFYNLSLQVGLEQWADYARRFHFGEPTQIDLPNESAGLVPDSSFMDSKYGAKGWTKGMILNLAVGQGDLLVTPLQMAYFAMILANDGKAYRPHLVRKIVDPESGEFVQIPRDFRHIPGISLETYRTLKEGMFRVVNGEKGTGRAARIAEVNVCGKTGTAENPHGEAHAWFIGFAPKDEPVVAFCFLVENGGSGGAVAAPMARGLLSLIFSRKHLVATNVTAPVVVD